MLKKVTIAFGVIFLLIGVLGFVPGVTMNDQNGQPLLFGFFVVSALHDIMYIASGVVALLAASSERYSRWYLQGFGLIYAVVAVVGLVQGDTVLGLFTVNMADNLLHTFLAIILLGVGFGLKTSGPSLPTKPSM